MAAWADSTLSTSIKIRKIHIDEIVSRLNTERTERGYGTISLSITSARTPIQYAHIMTIRTACDTTPLTVGCSSYNSTVYSSKYLSYGSSNSSYYSTANSGVYSPKYTTIYTGQNSSYCTSYTKGACFIGDRILWLGPTLL